MSYPAEWSTKLVPKEDNIHTLYILLNCQDGHVVNSTLTRPIYSAMRVLIRGQRDSSFITFFRPQCRFYDVIARVELLPVLRRKFRF
ncbi:hypothetical protein CEXT_753961 [Caerostris extrusa]|uniref:LAGLIDADG homing endonuclease n=1 Tax=Caerostris extrusa TaxID=172846 RepID=A0AAV4VN14_CAEEX|nr:hypothetical protein CEXT_753961 [Caerostris extrusa]